MLHDRLVEIPKKVSGGIKSVARNSGNAPNFHAKNSSD
jgi:hypothetical protein